MSDSDAIDLDRLRDTTFLANVDYHATLDSTQNQAIARATAGDRGPLLVLAEEQTAGRGRGANRWWTGRGSLAFSLLFDPGDLRLPTEAVPARSLAAGVAVVEAVSPLVYPHVVGLHWPNDVFIGHHKLAGILIDVLADGRHVLGIGINVNNTLASAPEDVRKRATSLLDLTGTTHDRTQLLISILAELEHAFRLAADDLDSFGDRFQQMCLQIGQPLSVQIGPRSLSGQCLGIAPDGALLLETPEGVEKLYSGTLHPPGDGSSD